MKRSAFWVAWGRQYIDEARASARTVKAHMPKIDRVLYVRSKDVAPAKKWSQGIFTRIIGSTFPKQLKHAHWMLRGLRMRVDAIMQLAEYDQLLFLDTDVHVCAPAHDLFQALRRFDIMFAHAGHVPRSRKGSPSMPAAFPEFNSGVVPFRNNGKVVDFHRHWLRVYRNHKDAFQNSNQRSLREVIWTDETGLQIGILPPEYNCRFKYGFWVRMQVKILHGRSVRRLSYQKIDQIVNSHYPMMRVWPQEVL